MLAPTQDPIGAISGKKHRSTHRPTRGHPSLWHGDLDPAPLAQERVKVRSCLLADLHMRRQPEMVVEKTHGSLLALQPTFQSAIRRWDRLGLASNYSWAKSLGQHQAIGRTHQKNRATHERGPAPPHLLDQNVWLYFMYTKRPMSKPPK